MVYPDVQLNTQDLYNLFPDGRLNHVGSTDHQVLCGQLLHHLQLLRCVITDVSSQLNLRYPLLWSSGYFGYLASTITSNFLAFGVKKGPEEEGHGEERGEGQAEVRDYEDFLVLLYTTRKLFTATNQFLSRVATPVLSLYNLAVQ